MQSPILSVLFFILLVFSEASLQASVRPAQKNISLVTALKTLNLPSERRLDFFKKPGGEKALLKIAFTKEPIDLGHRWRATTALAKLYPNSAGVKRALRHKDWYMRNAALLGLSEVKGPSAIDWSIRFLRNDASLIVRSAAVDILTKKATRRAKEALRQNINNKLNFRKGKPLWVRKNILQAVYQMSTKSDLPELISSLNSPLDPQHSKFLLEALPRVSGHSVNTSPYGNEKKAWLDWWDRKKTVNR